MFKYRDNIPKEQPPSFKYIQDLATAYLPVAIILDLQMNWRSNNWKLLQGVSQRYVFQGWLSIFDWMMLITMVVWLGALVLYIFGRVRDFYRARMALGFLLMCALMNANYFFPSNIAAYALQHLFNGMLLPVMIPQQYDQLAYIVSCVIWIPVELVLENAVSAIKEIKNGHYY
jgi:hypothetical protein